MDKGNQTSKSTVVSARVSDDLAKLVDTCAQEAGVSRGEWLASLLKRGATDKMKLTDDTLKRLDARARAKGISRAEYLARLIKTDLDSSTDNTPRTSWAFPWVWGKARHNKHRKAPGPKIPKTRLRLSDEIIRGFQPLATTTETPNGDRKSKSEDCNSDESPSDRGPGIEDLRPVADKC